MELQSIPIPRTVKWYRVALSALVWGLSSALIVGYFFISAFFPELAPYRSGDVGTAILVVPAFCGFMIGILMNEYETKHVIYGCFLLTAFSLILIYLTILLPIIVGPATEVSQLASGEQERQAAVLSAIFILPISVIGGILGKAFGSSYLPSEEERALRRLLAQDTQRWHEMLQAYLRGRIEQTNEGEPTDEEQQEKE